jgi:hypothetical protein
MLKRIALAVALSAIATSPLVAQQPEQYELAIPHLLEGADRDQDRTEVDRSAAAATSGQADARGPTPAMLKEIGAWLSQNLDLPQTSDLPAVRQVPPSELISLRLQPLTDAEREKVAAALRTGTLIRREPVALYNNRTKTIFLAEGWSSSNPADVSVLVHEMVHHLQNLAAHKFLCPQERERLAYAAQEKWLAQDGRSLATEFELDAFTLLVSTLCVH